VTETSSLREKHKTRLKGNKAAVKSLMDIYSNSP